MDYVGWVRRNPQMLARRPGMFPTDGPYAESKEYSLVRRTDGERSGTEARGVVISAPWVAEGDRKVVPAEASGDSGPA